MIKIILYFVFIYLSVFQLRAQNHSEVLFQQQSSVLSPEILLPAVTNKNTGYLLQLDSVGECASADVSDRTFFYDHNHRLIKELYNDNQQKSEYFYDSFHNLSFILYSHYNDFLTHDWDPVYMWQFVYNEYNIPIGYTIFSWSYDMYSTHLQWQPQSRREALFDSVGNVFQNNYYFWINEQNLWFNHQKTTHSYNDSLRLDIKYHWDTLSLQWVHVSKTEVITDSHNRIVESTTYNADTSGWVTQYKFEHVYDMHGNLIEKLYSNAISGILNEIGKNTFFYDLAYATDDLVMPFNFYPGNQNKLTHVALHVKDSTGWQLFRCDTLYYSAISTGLDVPEVQTPSVFPNPFRNYLQLEIAGSYYFELFDLQGRKIMTFEADGFQRIDAAHLSRGIYFYNLYINGQKHSGKIIKH